MDSQQQGIIASNIIHHSSTVPDEQPQLQELKLGNQKSVDEEQPVLTMKQRLEIMNKPKEQKKPTPINYKNEPRRVSTRVPLEFQNMLGALIVKKDPPQTQNTEQLTTNPITQSNNAQKLINQESTVVIPTQEMLLSRPMKNKRPRSKIIGSDFQKQEQKIPEGNQEQKIPERKQVQRIQESNQQQKILESNKEQIIKESKQKQIIQEIQQEQKLQQSVVQPNPISMIIETADEQQDDNNQKVKQQSEGNHNFYLRSQSPEFELLNQRQRQ